MKRYNIWKVCLIALAILVLCCGCSAILQSVENTEIRSCTETMLDALIADDFQTAYQLVSNVCTEKEFEKTFAQMQEFLGDENSYELKLLSIHTSTNISNGQQSSAISSVYEMTTPSNRVIVSVRADGQYNLNSFYLTPYEKTDYYFTGTLETMKAASGAQWAILLINVIAIGLTVVALVDCCRHKIRKKALWIILLLLGFVSVGATISASGFNLNFNVGWIIAYSALIRYGTGTVVLRLMLPVGTIIYFIKRRSLLNTQPPVIIPCEAEPVSEQTSANDQTQNS